MARRRPPATTAASRATPAPYLLLLVVVGLLTIIGLMMVLSASSVQALRDHGSSWYFFNRQLVWVVLGAAAMVFAARTDYRILRRWGPLITVVAVLMMILVLVPGVGITVGGSSRWLGAGPFRVQPSELAKLGLLIFAADLLTKRADRIRDSRFTVRPVLFAFGVVAFLLLMQPDLGTTLVTGLIVMSVLFVAGTPMSSIAKLGIGAALGTLFLAKIEPYRWRRMTSFLDPWADAGNTGYQAAQGQVALASGGLTGLGLGASRAKWGFLPAAHTDFIFAIIGEELGLVGALAVVSLFLALTALGVRASLRAPDRFGMLMAAGATAWIIGQAFINIGAVIGILPITGVPLPFVSSGGSSLVIVMAVTGVLLNITRQGRPVTAAGSRADTAAA